MAIQAGEKVILKGALDLLTLRGYLAWRTNAGSIPRRGHWIKLEPGGTADVIGLTPVGRFLAVETKAPGKKPTPTQAAFLNQVREAGGVAVWIDDLGTLDRVLQHLGRDPHARFEIDGQEAEGFSVQPGNDFRLNRKEFPPISLES